MKKNIRKRLLSLALALVLVLGMLPHFPLAASAAEASDYSDYIVTLPSLKKTLYFNGEMQQILNPGEANDGYYLVYQTSNMLLWSPELSMKYPETLVVYYAVFEEGTNTLSGNGMVYGPEKLGTVTMKRAIPEYDQVPTAKNSETPYGNLVNAGSSTLPTFFTVQYRTSTSEEWSTEIPMVYGPGKYTVYYRLHQTKDYFNLDAAGAEKTYDSLLDLSDPKEGSVTVTMGMEPSVIRTPAAKTSLSYTDRAQELLSDLGKAENGTLQYAVTAASVTDAPTSWSDSMPTATDAGSYKVWYKVEGNLPFYYDTDPAYVSVEIKKATPTVSTWPTIKDIFVGDILEDSDLSGGSASVDGIFSAGEGQSWDIAGVQSATLTFAPTDEQNYNTVTSDGNGVNVVKRTAKSVAAQNGITKPYGTAQDALGLPEKVTLETHDGETYQVPVVWSGYNPEPAQLGTQTLTGELDMTGIENQVQQPQEPVTASIQVTLTNRDPGQANYENKSAPYTGSPITHELEALPEGVDSASYSYTGEHTLPGEYTVTANFTMKDFYDQLTPATAKLTITKAQLENVKVEQSVDLTYNGESQIPEVTASASSKGDQQVKFVYSAEKNGEYGPMPQFTAAGQHTVWYKASAQYHDDAEGSFPVTIDKQEVTPPTIDSKVYNTGLQTAGVTETGLYTVTKDEGGTEGGEYPVVLTLKDPANYCWPDSYQDKISGENGKDLTLTFTITAADNAWKADPNISGWTYGETASVPDMGEATYGEAQVTYAGTTNAGNPYESTKAPTEAGEYKAVFTIDGTSSYEVLTKEIPFTVARAALPTDIAFDYTAPTLTYNGLEQSVTVTANLPGVDAADITLNYSAAPKNAGEYTFTVSVAQSDNYEASAEPLTNENWKFTIGKATPVISWDTTEFIYNTQPQGEAKVAQVNEEVYGGKITYTHKQGEAEAADCLPTNAGTYKVTAAIADQPNYKAASSETTIVINPKEVTPTVVLTPDSYHYDGQAKKPAVKLMDEDVEIPTGEYTVTWGNNTAVGAANAWIRDNTGGNYTIADNTKGVFLILPDVSALEGVTTENVNSSHQAAIDAIQAAMSGKEIDEASEEAQKQWNDLLARCTALEAKISDAKTGSDAIIAGTAALPEQPKTSELNTIQGLLDKYDAIEDNLTEAEKEALADEIKKLEDLKKAITETNADLKEITDGANALNKDDLDFADKATIADLQKKIDDLESNPYLTDTQKQTLADAEEKLAELKAEFAEADKVTEQLNKLPTTANPDSKTAVEAYEAAKKAYGDLGEDKSKVDPNSVKKLEALKTELTDYKITKGSGAKWVKGSSDGLSFTANGYFGKFTGIKVDGKLIDSSNYTAKSGSTIVTLKASYLQKLKTGKHTIAICYGDGDFTGEATGTFKVVTYNGNPFTGDQIMIAVAVMTVSAVALVALLVVKKRNRK